MNTVNREFYAFVFLLSITILKCSAQERSKTKSLQFHSINNVGLLEGEAGSAFQLQTVNGVQYKSWFVGIGAGLDYYRYRTIPLFIDARKEFGKSNNKFFVYADAGINFYWERDKDAKQFYYDDKFKNGFYAEGGLGYKRKLNQKSSLLFSAGYSYKKLTEEGHSFWFDPGFPGSPYPIEKINYNLNRLVLKAGIEF
jgi:hypothetical protein